MTKRQRVLTAIENKTEADCVPVCVSLHFDREAAYGDKAVDAHLRFFRETDTDVIKIMNENLIPEVGEIASPGDWDKIPDYSMRDAFLARQSEMTAAIVDKADKDAFLIGTVHGICASAIHPIESLYSYELARRLLCDCLRRDDKPVLAAFSRIADGLCLLVGRYAALGLDAIYYAALGGERRYYTNSEFAAAAEPFDRRVMKAAKDAGLKVILHICKDGIAMERYRGYADLADVVNWGVYETDFSLAQGRELFPNTALMGGLANRSGPMTDGSQEDLNRAAEEVARANGKKGFILGADCTLPTETPYARIKSMVDAIRSI